MEIKIPDKIIKDAVYDAIKGQKLEESIAKMLMDEQAKTSKDGYFVDAVHVGGKCREKEINGWFLYNLLGELDFERKEGSEYLIKIWCDEPVRAVEITKKIGEGEYYVSDGGSRILEYSRIGISNCLDDSLLETNKYKGMKELLKSGIIEVYNRD
ncbi:MAG: hypothetical protein KAT28_02800 [Candidatus Aenigmarchaeota archaeon]|nr:hypothetical protein [Candidatus Aenigmarchaeota archaeon]